MNFGRGIIRYLNFKELIESMSDSRRSSFSENRQKAELLEDTLNEYYKPRVNKDKANLT